MTAENLEMYESKSVSVKGLNEAAMEFNHGRTDSQFVNEYLAGSLSKDYGLYGGINVSTFNS